MADSTVNLQLLVSAAESQNPIWELAIKHDVQFASNSWQDLSFFDHNGENTKDFPLHYGLGAQRYKHLLSVAGGSKCSCFPHKLIIVIW